jgi:hypothetical protein
MLLVVAVRILLTVIKTTFALIAVHPTKTFSEDPKYPREMTKKIIGGMIGSKMKILI